MIMKRYARNSHQFVMNPTMSHTPKMQSKFYIEELGWTSDQFEAVDWDALHWTMSKKKLMYSLCGFQNRLQNSVVLAYKCHGCKRVPMIDVLTATAQKKGPLISTFARVYFEPDSFWTQ
jgi:hypothetical protein